MIPNILNIKTLFYETKARAFPIGETIYQSAKVLGANLIPVVSHWNIKELHGNEALSPHWNKIKREVLVLGIKGKMFCRENGRSTDFAAPSHANGCTAACTYCYVARRKGYVNPITVFANANQAVDYVHKHATNLGPKKVGNQCDSSFWIYDIGENNDCSVDHMISPAVSMFVNMFANHPYAKGSFATKFVNRDLLSLNPKKKTRIRFSLMPEPIRKIVDVRTDSIAERLGAINDFSDASWEVHVNLSPVITYPGWDNDWRELLRQLNEIVREDVKREVQAEVIFLTHNKDLHELNLQWHPKGEEFLWNPSIQEDKISQTGGCNLRYRRDYKAIWIQRFRKLVETECPWLNIRYIF